MGWAARANPCALPAKNARKVVRARLARVADRFETKAEFFAWLDQTGQAPTPEQREYLHGLLPERLRA